MLRIFLDSSVLFAASYSSKGYARDLIRLSINKIIVPIASPLVFEETRRNLAFFSAVSLPYLEKVIELVNFEIVIPTKKDVQDATRIIVLKDAPILAAAKIARVDALTTMDKKHLLGKPSLEEYIGSPIVTPREAFGLITNDLKQHQT